MSDEQVEEAQEKTGGKKKLVMIVVPIVVVIAGAAGFFLRGGDTAEAALARDVDVVVTAGAGTVPSSYRAATWSQNTSKLPPSVSVCTPSRALICQSLIF